MDQRINQFAGGQSGAMMTKNLNPSSRDNERDRNPHTQQVMGMSSVGGIGLSSSKRHQIMQQSDALYQ